jgi:hypothetical protein
MIHTARIKADNVKVLPIKWLDMRAWCGVGFGIDGVLEPRARTDQSIDARRGRPT